MHADYTVQETLCTVYALFPGPTTTLFRKKLKIKNRFHGTIYTSKTYFATVFSVFSFQQNKLYSNGPLFDFYEIFEKLCYGNI